MGRRRARAYFFCRRRIMLKTTGLALLAWAAIQLPAPSNAKGRRAFDLGVTSVEVTEKESSTMFRKVRVRCDILNHGPGPAPAKVRVIITRPTASNQRKVVRDIVTRYRVSPGRSFFIAGEDTVWRAANPSYRCAIDYGPPGALRIVGDTNLANDVGQSPRSK